MPVLKSKAHVSFDNQYYMKNKVQNIWHSHMKVSIVFIKYRYLELDNIGGFPMNIRSYSFRYFIKALSIWA